ncbi:MAG: DUF2164 domain-containing protein [Acidobacteriota bacterium]|nr:MAG: DUF2164 domain-containing protein [Acidobacteriota bacterium]
MTINFKTEIEQQMIQSIKRYFRDELEQEIGDLKARLLLNFIKLEIGPVIYNEAIRDAQGFFQDRVVDLEGACFEPEFTYWKD